MKKIISVILILLMIISLSACSPKNETFSRNEMNKKMNTYTTKLDNITANYDMKESKTIDDFAIIYLGDKKLGLLNSYENSYSHLDVVFAFDKKDNLYSNPEIFVNFYIFTNTGKTALESPNDKTKTKVFSDIISSFTGNKDLSKQILNESYNGLKEIYEDEKDEFNKPLSNEDEFVSYNGEPANRKVSFGFYGDRGKKFGASWQATEPINLSK